MQSAGLGLRCCWLAFPPFLCFLKDSQNLRNWRNLWTGAVQPFDGSPESGEAGEAVETGTVFLPAVSLGILDDPHDPWPSCILQNSTRIEVAGR